MALVASHITVQYCLPELLAHTPPVPHCEESVHTLPTAAGGVTGPAISSVAAGEHVPSAWQVWSAPHAGVHVGVGDPGMQTPP